MCEDIRVVVRERERKRYIAIRGSEGNRGDKREREKEKSGQTDKWER